MTISNGYITAFSIILSGIISWIISAIYFKKNNRENLKNSIVAPLLKFLKQPYNTKTYKQIQKLTQNYSYVYFTKKEKNFLSELTIKYEHFVSFNEITIKTNALCNHFETTLKNIDYNINIEPIFCEGEIIGHDIPSELTYNLYNNVNNLIKYYENDYILNYGELEYKINKLFNNTKNEYFSGNYINFFEQTSLSKIIEGYPKYNDYLTALKELNVSKENFVSLKIAQSVLTI